MSVRQPLATSSDLDVWYTVCPTPAGSSIGLGRGDFARAFLGRRITLNNIRTHPDRAVREAHYNHSQRNGFREGGNVPPIWARSKGEDVRVLGLVWIDRTDQIAVLGESALIRPEDLRGKRIGIVTRPNDQIDFTRADELHAFEQVLTSANLTLADVEVVDLAIGEPLVSKPPSGSSLSGSSYDIAKRTAARGQKFRALLSGKVDAIHISYADRETTWLLGLRCLIDITAQLPRESRLRGGSLLTLTVRGELLREHPDVVDRYVAQVIRTARWAKRNPAEAIRWIARDTGLAEETVPRAFHGQIAEVLEPSLEPWLVEALSKQKDFLFRHGFIPADFDVQDWVAQGALDRARAIVDAEDAS